MQAIAIFDIDGVLRDVGGSYRRALADTVEHFTQSAYRPSQVDIDTLKAEGLWNNDWEASRELVYRYFEQHGQLRSQIGLNYEDLVDFFQRKYRGSDLDHPERWDGYISQEPLLVSAEYFQQLTDAGIAWGFFSGATRGSATYILERRIGLRSPQLIAMEDAPGKPDPTGLLDMVQQLTEIHQLAADLPVFYAGDTVADMQTVNHAQHQAPNRHWIGIGILPPHAQHPPDYRDRYQQNLEASGARIVLDHIEQLNPKQFQTLQATVPLGVQLTSTL